MLAAVSRFDVILVQLPLPDLSATGLMTCLRRRYAPCRKTPVIFLAPPHHWQATAVYRDEQTANLPLSTPPFELRQRVASILGFSVRDSFRLRTELPVRLAADRARRDYRTENLSRTGMLVRSTELAPIGTAVEFELQLFPGTPGCQGFGEIVRHAVPEHEKIQGMGVRFSSLREEDEDRLEEYLQRSGAP